MSTGKKIKKGLKVVYYSIAIPTVLIFCIVIVGLVYGCTNKDVQKEAIEKALHSK